MPQRLETLSVPRTEVGVLIDSTVPINIAASSGGLSPGVWPHYVSVQVFAGGGSGTFLMATGVSVIGFVLLVNTTTGPAAGSLVQIYDTVAAGSPPVTQMIDIGGVPSQGAFYRVYAMPCLTGGVKVKFGTAAGIQFQCLLGYS